MWNADVTDGNMWDNSPIAFSSRDLWFVDWCNWHASCVFWVSNFVVVACLSATIWVCDSETSCLQTEWSQFVYLFFCCILFLLLTFILTQGFAMMRIRIIKVSVFVDINPPVSMGGISIIVRFFTHPSLFLVYCVVFVCDWEISIFLNWLLCVYFFGSRILS